LQADADDAGVELQEMHAIYAKGIPVGRIATSDDIARTAVFLSTSAPAAYVGQTTDSNGGEIRCSM